MTPVAGEERWEVLELIGSYTAGELEGEATRAVFGRPEREEWGDAWR
jgi:hypothetical protein